MRWLLFLVSMLLSSLASAEGLRDVYWFRYQDPICSGSQSMFSVLTGGQLFSKQLTIDENYFSVTDADIDRMPYSLIYEQVTLSQDKAMGFRSAVRSMGEQGQVPQLIGQGLSLSLSAFFAFYKVPLWASLAGDATLSRFIDGVNAIGTPYIHLSDFIAKGGGLKQVLYYSKNIAGQPTVTRSYVYEVSVGEERRAFVLASCVYAVKTEHAGFTGSCGPNPDEFGLPSFCRQRAERHGWRGACGDQRLDIDGTTNSCTRDQRPLCDPDSFCLCDFDQQCYLECKAIGDCNKHGKRR